MGGEIEIESVRAIRDLISAMDDVRGQQAEMLQYVSEWVCQREGFQPSDLCALKPLAGAMDKVEEAFYSVSDTFDRRWGDLEEAVARSVQELQRQEGETVTSMDVLLSVTKSADHRGVAQ